LLSSSSRRNFSNFSDHTNTQPTRQQYNKKKTIQQEKTMTSLATTNIPTCKWAQRKECVYVTVDIPDAKDETITVANDKLTFKAVSGGKN